MTEEDKRARKLARTRQAVSRMFEMLDLASDDPEAERLILLECHRRVMRGLRKGPRLVRQKRADATATRRIAEHIEEQCAAAAPQILIASTDMQQRLSYASQSWLRYTGLTLEEVVGAGWSLAIHPDDLPGLEAAVAESYPQRKPLFAEHRLRRCNGQYGSVVTLAFSYFRKGTFLGYVATAWEIDERAARATRTIKPASGRSAPRRTRGPYERYFSARGSRSEQTL